MVGSRQCGLCATPGACPCELLFEGLQRLNSLRRGLPSIWFGKGVAGFIVLEGFQAHAWFLLWMNVLLYAQGSAVCGFHGSEIH